MEVRESEEMVDLIKEGVEITDVEDRIWKEE